MKVDQTKQLFHNAKKFLLILDSTNVDDEVVGEVSVQVDLFTQAGSGEHKVTVKGEKVLPLISYEDST